MNINEEKRNSDGGADAPAANPSQQELLELLQSSRTIAVVGLSDNPGRYSCIIAAYLKSKGYRIIPVNPKKTEILQEKCYPDLLAIPDPVDIVDIFRNTEALPGIVDEAIKIGAGAVWMQQGLSHSKAAQKARAAGMCVIQNLCIMVQHRKLLR